MDVSGVSVDEPITRTIYRKEIDNADGSGVDVYEADSLEELVDKLATGKANANKKIRELNTRVKAETVQTAQEQADAEYIIGEKLKKNPKATVKELVAETLREQADALARSNKVQSDFVNTHPDYAPVEANGNKLVAWIRTNGYTEFTQDNLEKAYQDLKQSGLLKLKSADASAATTANTEVTERTVQPAVDASQQRSQKKSSGISARSGVSAVANRTSGPSEDELYKMPLDQLRALADQQMAAAANQ